jgi:hypothetical protein
MASKLKELDEERKVSSTQQNFYSNGQDDTLPPSSQGRSYDYIIFKPIKEN